MSGERGISLADKVAVLIGAGYIGRAIIKVACAGERLIVCDASDAILKEAAEEFANNGFDTVCMNIDLGSADDMSSLPFVESIDASPKAYALAKYSNILRARSAAAAWAKSGATINSISPGLVMTPVIRGMLESDKGEGFRKLLAGSPAGRAATPSEVGELARLLMTNRMITGTDVLIDGGITASKHAPQ